jgi:hypothetical protein
VPQQLDRIGTSLCAAPALVWQEGVSFARCL